MAWTVTKLDNTIHGNERVTRYSVTTDSTSEELYTGYTHVNQANLEPKSMTSNVWNLSLNALTAATASQGYVSITGVVSGDDFYLTVHGR